MYLNKDRKKVIDMAPNKQWLLNKWYLLLPFACLAFQTCPSAILLEHFLIPSALMD